MISVRIGKRYVPLPDSLIQAILEHAKVNVTYGRARKNSMEQNAASKAAHDAELKLIAAIGSFADAVMTESIERRRASRVNSARPDRPARIIAVDGDPDGI